MSETKLPKIAKYELAERIGETPIGPIYRGRHVQLGVDVALRVLSPALMKKFPELQDQFLADARAAGKVEHPCVARVIDCGLDNQLYFVASQWPTGETLAKTLEQGSLEPERALEIARDVAQGLAAGTREGLLHGAVRPECIVVAPGQNARIRDLGLTRLNEAQLEVAAAAGVPRPSAHFRAPEVCDDPAKVSAQSDMFSLGAVLFTMLAGVRPFEGPSDFELEQAILDQPPLDLKKEKPSLSQPVADFVNRLLAKTPQERFKDYESLLAALEATMGKIQMPPATDLPATPTDAPPPPARRKGATTRQAPSGGGRKGTTRATGGVSGTRRQGGVSGTGRSTAVRTGTGRQEPTPAPTGSKTPMLIIGSLVLLAVAGAVVTVILMDSGKPAKPTITNPVADGNPAQGDPNQPPPPPPPPPPPAIDPDTQKFREQLADFEAQMGQVGKSGDLALENKLQVFADANAKQLEIKKVLDWLARLKTLRLEASYQAATLEQGRARLEALDAFLKEFPDSRHQEAAVQLRADTAVLLQASDWAAEYDIFDKALSKVAMEEIDTRRQLIAAYLQATADQPGNPNRPQAEKKQADLEIDATARLKTAVDAADKDLVYNNFEAAIDRLLSYKMRFRDKINHPQADEKMREIATKAFAFWTETRKIALAKLAKDVTSKTARQEIDNSLIKLKGVGTLADDAKQFGEDLKVFDDLHKRAASNDVIPNVQNRKMPECLYVQNKTGLSIREIDDKRLKMTEGGTPVTYMKNWADLTLAERLTVYAYLLQPEDEEMPPEVQTLLDKAKKVIQP